MPFLPGAWANSWLACLKPPALSRKSLASLLCTGSVENTQRSTREERLPDSSFNILSASTHLIWKTEHHAIFPFIDTSAVTGLHCTQEPSTSEEQMVLSRQPLYSCPCSWHTWVQSCTLINDSGRDDRIHAPPGHQLQLEQTCQRDTAPPETTQSNTELVLPLSGWALVDKQSYLALIAGTDFTPPDWLEHLTTDSPEA